MLKTDPANHYEVAENDGQQAKSRKTLLLNFCLRSKVRRLVMKALLDFDDFKPAAEICRVTKLSMNQVLGALWGIRGQYEPEVSLITLGIVEAEVIQLTRKKSQRVYRLKFDGRSDKTIAGIMRKWERLPDG